MELNCLEEMIYLITGIFCFLGISVSIWSIFFYKPREIENENYELKEKLWNHIHVYPQKKNDDV